VSIDARAARIKLLLFDIDGVLTDGTVVIHADGSESKAFGIRDGIAIVWAQRAGLKVGFLSARASATTLHRAAQIGVTLVHQAVKKSKVAAYQDILAGEGLRDDEVAFMGDDIVDLAVLGRVGLAAAPANAVEDVRRRVHFVSRCNGGASAARELVELVLRATNAGTPSSRVSGRSGAYASSGTIWRCSSVTISKPGNA
jgi:3-deoxy-D-manno-octulosonate 8-phosphate phosphatase (KDO 8-P phosphatase)